MKVLVTGANGFLGHWLTKELVAQGHEVFALVRPKSDVSELDGINCKFLYGDVTDLDSLNKTFVGMDAVFHLAGVVAYRYSERALMEKVNVQGTANVIAAVEKCRVTRMVHMSSVVAIGASFSPDQVLTEASEFNLGEYNLGYFETKLASEKLVAAAFKSNRIDAVILNPSTIYGAGDAKKGSRKTQIKVARGQFPFYTPGGVNVVDVEDVVQGVLSAWKLGRSGERYILCSENLTIKRLFEIIAEEGGVQPPKLQLPYSVLHFLGAVGDLGYKLGVESSVTRENARTSTLFHWFDCSKAKKELGFYPKPSRQPIHKSVQWMRENGYLESGK